MYDIVFANFFHPYYFLEFGGNTWVAALGRFRATEDARRAEIIDILYAF